METTKPHPSISLAMICKNERHHLPNLLASVKDCFDEIHITDTGSDDGTVDFLLSDEAKELAGCPVHVHHMEWPNDFAVARTKSFEPVRTEYVMWLDCDDVLSDRQAFIDFRDNVMSTADYWLAAYHYAFDDQGTPICTFLRERVVKMGAGFHWKYFVHEGFVQTEGKHFRAQRVSSWLVKHVRTEDDIKADRSRNLRLFEEHDRTKGLCPRMTYYYGKELFEARQFMQAGAKLVEATKMDLEPHDKTLAYQYAMASALECGQNDWLIELGMKAINNHPQRAEYWVLIGDAYIKKGDLPKAQLFYETARHCRPDSQNGFVTLSGHAYNKYPTEQLAVIALNLGELDRAKNEIDRLEKMNPARAFQLQTDWERLSRLTKYPIDAQETDEIVITTPVMHGPNQDWDERMHETRGLGGSETAAVELAEYWQKTTGRQVIIFNNRKTDHISPTGVIYRSVSQVPEYMQKNKPFIHIAWRHAHRLTDAPSYIWCHDLFTPGAEALQNYDKIICLSEFHKKYVKALQNIPDDKIVLARNGIEPKHFKQDAVKNPNKVIFPSSPDRGLDRAIEIVRRAREKTGRDLELHVFYGFENMKAMGMAPQAAHLEKLISENSFVKYHGNVKKDELAKHFLESAVWVYPADFIETFCITALEAVAGGCYSIIRNFGGVVDTARPFVNNGMGEILDSDCKTDEEFEIWSTRLAEAILEEKWRKVSVNPEAISWQTVAGQWADQFKLKKTAKVSEEVRDMRKAFKTFDQGPELTM